MTKEATVGRMAGPGSGRTGELHAVLNYSLRQCETMEAFLSKEGRRSGMNVRNIPQATSLGGLVVKTLRFLCRGHRFEP